MADPSANVFNGKLYIYPSHDWDSGEAFDDDGGHFQMHDYHVLSIEGDDPMTSPVKDNGVILDVKDVAWAEKQMWDNDVVEKDGKYYLISDSDKSVISMAYEEGDDDIMTFPSSYEVLGSGNGKLDGKSYYYENSKDADGIISTYWYNGNDLYAIQNVDSIIYIESVTQKADASKFAVPQGYDVIDMSDLASLFGDFSSDDWYSDDSSSSWDNWDSYTGDGWTYDSSDSWWDDDTDYSPNYYALGQYFGLTEAQAEEFSTAMYAVQYMDWGTLNEYVTSGKFDFKGKKLENFTDLASYEITALQKLVQGFKK